MLHLIQFVTIRASLVNDQTIPLKSVAVEGVQFISSTWSFHEASLLLWFQHGWPKGNKTLERHERRRDVFPWEAPRWSRAASTKTRSVLTAAETFLHRQRLWGRSSAFSPACCLWGPCGRSEGGKQGPCCSCTLLYLKLLSGPVTNDRLIILLIN